MSDRLLVTVCPSIPPYMAQYFPGMSLRPEHIADEVVRAWEAGANIVHMHVWDEHGQPSIDLAAFERTIALIRARCDIIIEGSTGGFNDLTPRQRSVSLKARIEMASLNPGSVNYENGVYINTPSDIDYWAGEMKRLSIKPDVAIFEAGMITNTLVLVERGLVDTPLLFTFVLGQKGALSASVKNLLFLAESVPQGSLWAVAGHNGNDLTCNAQAISIGGHARAGFEDNPYYRPGEPATSNAQLIERLVRIAREIGREPASPAEARTMLGLTV